MSDVERLPHEFDLCYDCKTLKELNREYTRLLHCVAELEDLKNLAKHYNITLTGLKIQ
jgi:hypothetical protein